MDSQKGMVPVIVLISIIALIGFLALLSIAPFNNKLFSSLFPKQSSRAASNFGLSFDDIDDTAQTASIYPGSTGTQTFEAWVKPTVNNAFGMIMSTRNDADNQGWLMELRNGQLELWIADPTGTDRNVLNTATAMTAGNWYHVAATYNASTKIAQLFVNGTPGNSANLNTLSQGPRFRLGTFGSGGFTVYKACKCLIDEVRISNSIRYSSSFTPSSSFSADANTLALYHFDEGSGQSVSDASTNAISLTLGLANTAESSDPTWSILSSPTPTPSIPPVSASSTSFRVAAGYADNLPRQIVRTNSDKLYLFASVVQTPNVLKSYWTNSTGFPNAGTEFNGATQTSNGTQIVSADAVYDGTTIIHVLVNDMSNTVKDYPFDITTNSFKPAKTIATGTGKPASYTDIGTAGVSGMFDKSNNLHIAYWTSSNQIMHKSYTYTSSTDTLTQTSGPTRLDSSGTANHPQIVVSPLDNSVTVAWVNGSSGAGTISARTRSATGTWGTIEAASSGPVWTSSNSGINIDQGPSMVITSDGVKHLIYIENFDGTGDYGKTHYVRNSGSGWVDTAISQFYTHAPGIATDSSNNLFILGHGHPNNPSCKSMLDVCFSQRNSNGSWTNPTLHTTHPNSDSLDASLSIKWSVVGWNKPETVEFLFFSANNGSYANTDIWYGRLATSGSASPSPIPTTAASPIPTPNPSPSTPPKVGDIIINNKVDIFDYNALLTDFGKKNDPITPADLDDDNDVDIFDYNILLTNFGQ